MAVTICGNGGGGGGLILFTSVVRKVRPFRGIRHGAASSVPPRVSSVPAPRESPLQICCSWTNP